MQSEIKAHDFNAFGGDTDSIIFCKKDMSEFTQDEQDALIMEINSLLPDRIKFSHDGYFSTVLYFKAKNYVLYDGKKLKTKGSALKDAKKEIALKDFSSEVVWAIINKASTEDLQKIYLKYVLEVRDGIKEIKRWCSKKTLTDKVFTSARTNETKVLDAIEGTEYKESDKIWVYFAEDESLQLMEKYDGKYHKERMYKKVFNTAEFFMGKKATPGVLPLGTFPNYSLKKNQKLLELV